jgi:hypothetical protein
LYDGSLFNLIVSNILKGEAGIGSKHLFRPQLAFISDYRAFEGLV